MTAPASRDVDHVLSATSQLRDPLADVVGDFGADEVDGGVGPVAVGPVVRLGAARGAADEALPPPQAAVPSSATATTRSTDWCRRQGRARVVDTSGRNRASNPPDTE
jgi:hypothetical protein